jgi:hypothetical protein
LARAWAPPCSRRFRVDRFGIKFVGADRLATLVETVSGVEVSYTGAPSWSLSTGRREWRSWSEQPRGVIVEFARRFRVGDRLGRTADRAIPTVHRHGDRSP